MFEFFYNTICENEEVVKKLKNLSKKYPEFQNTAINTARFLVRTKKTALFTEAVRSTLTYIKTINQELYDYYPLMIFAAAADLTAEMHSEMGIPYEITVDTLRDINVWIGNFYTSNGRYGLSNYVWLAGHFAGNLFKIGRLQYEIMAYPAWSYVFKNNETGEIVTLSPDADVTASGHITGSSGENDCQFRAVFSNNPDDYTGNIIDIENGIILKDRMSLPKKDWKLILKPGDMAVYIHIPQGEKLEYDKCKKSMEQAKEFFARYYPQIEFYALISSTWLLDPNLVHILPEESNIIKFMRMFSKVPVCREIPMIFERVFGFGFEEKDIESAPENTSLQRSLKRYTLNGGKMYTTGGYIIW
jgi:hypothetical protein